jgi:ProP effector
MRITRLGVPRCARSGPRPTRRLGKAARRRGVLTLSLQGTTIAGTEGRNVPMQLRATPAMQAAIAARLQPKAEPDAPRGAAKPRPVAAEQPAPKPQPPTPGSDEPRRARNERYKRTRDLLQRRWPEIFGWARPLAIGIHRDLERELDGEISRKDLDRFLCYWVRRPAYKKALAAGTPRVNLDGEPVSNGHKT